MEQVFPLTTTTLQLPTQRKKEKKCIQYLHGIFSKSDTGPALQLSLSLVALYCTAAVVAGPRTPPPNDCMVYIIEVIKS